MKTIIIATDFSAEAINATKYIAKAITGKAYQLVLYNLYNTSIHAQNARLSAMEIDKMFQAQKNKVNEKASTLSEMYHVEVVAHVVAGNFYDELVKSIQQFNAELVVMGMAERSVEQDLLGNTTTAAISMLKFPVLSIPLGTEYNGIKHILFACDIVRGVHKTVLDRVREVAADYHASVEVFHIREKSEEFMQQQDEKYPMEETLSGIQHTYKNVQSSEIIKAIRDEIVASETDLLIMVPYKYGFWDSMLHKSKTRAMASGSKVPLLSLPL
ncbi:universal stress protein [Flavobacterium supellecticarium]|uniref:Universal stress protein n=1 Tax=Flavobacterium supellecticarium TaxID=2565924 RepID=A0A4S4A4U8_9FLAO|nr:universal stress protein [Flavobacterium supellecticarium]THF53333.1 universal stress protein [Flavobacterium supellecticarium]